MYYNEFKGKELSALGFGCMRFAKDASGEIDQALVDSMFDAAIAAGVNYFDTAYPYLDGKSELAVAKALAKYPRDSYYLADKFPGHSLPGPIDNIALFNISLAKCSVDYFDFYLLHNVNEWTYKIYIDSEYHIIPDMLKMKNEGHIHHLGFSFHGGTELLEKMLTEFEGMFDFVQIQLNYLDWTLQDAKEKYEIITKHGLGVWVMEPCRGGKLASLPESAAAKLDPAFSHASYAFRFLQSLPNVKVILSGMNSLEQVKDNIHTFDQMSPLAPVEEQTLLDIAESMKNGVPCTACRYCCKGCPMGLDIPMLISCYNTFKYSHDVSTSMRLDGLDESKLPKACIGCSQCSQACPQGINVPAVLAELSDMYENGPRWSDISAGRKVTIKRDLNMAD